MGPKTRRLTQIRPSAFEILESLSAGVLVVDEDKTIAFANAAAARVLGTGDCLGQNAETLLNLRVVEKLTGGQRAESWFTNVAGVDIHIGVSVDRYQPMQGPGGYILVFRALGADGIPDEASMRHLERLAAIGQMVAGFAHEVRNPLAALSALVEDLAAETPEEDPRGEHVKRIHNVVRRLENLLRTSLQFGRPSQPSSRVHNSTALVNGALDLLKPRLQQIGMGVSDIRTELAPGVRDVVVDDGQIIQVLVILLNNALDATLDPGLVQVRLKERAVDRGTHSTTSVVIEVEDQGPGIPAERLGQIFNAFFTTKDKGTGLGLSIALKLVRENQGQLTVRSDVGKGTLFSIELPAVGG